MDIFAHPSILRRKRRGIQPEVINHLHTSSERMWDLISLGDIPITYIESRLMIEYEFLKGFTMPPPRRGR